MADNAQNLILATIFKAVVDPGAAAQIASFKTQLAGLNTSLNATNTAGGKAGKGVKDVNKEVKKGKEPLTRYATAVKKVRSAFKTLLAYAFVGKVIQGITSAFTGGVNEIIEYDQALKNLQAITGATEIELGALGNTILQVATTTRFSSAEVGKGMVLLSQSGFTASESMNSMQSVADLATGTLSTMATVTDLLTTSIRAFGLEAVESRRVADVMANAINKSKLTVDKMRIAFNFVGASASLAGLSIEETSAAMMVLANNGLRASTIGTGLRQVLKRLIAPNSDLRDAYSQSGIELDKINPKTVGFKQVLLNLARVLWDSKERTVDMAKAFDLFGLRGAQAAAILVKEFVSNKYEKALKAAFNIGTAAEMAATQFKGLQVSIKNLSDVWGVLFVNLGEAGAKGMMTAVLDTVRELVNWMKDLSTSMVGGIIVKTALLTTGMYALSVSIKGVIWAFSTLGPMVAKLFPFLTVSTNWWALLAIAIAGVAAVSYQLSTENKRNARELSELAVKTEGVVNAFEVYAGAMQELYDKYKQSNDDTAYRANMERLKKDFPELTTSIIGTTEAFEEDKTAMDQIVSDAQIEKVANLTGAISKYRDAVRDAAIWMGIWESVKDIGTGAKDTYLKFVMFYIKNWSKAGSIVGNTLDGMSTKIREFGKGDPLFEKLADLLEMPTNVVHSIGNGITRSFETLIEKGMDTNVVKGLIKEKTTMIAELAKEAFDAEVASGMMLKPLDWASMNLLDSFPDLNDLEMLKFLEIGDKLREEYYINEKERIAKENDLTRKRKKNEIDVLEEMKNEADAIQRVRLDQMTKAMKSEVSRFREIKEAEWVIEKKTATEKVQAWKDLTSEIEAIQARHLVKMKKMMLEDPIYYAKKGLRDLSDAKKEYNSIPDDEKTLSDLMSLADKAKIASQKIDLLAKAWEEFKTKVIVKPEESEYIDQLLSQFSRADSEIQGMIANKDDKILNGWKTNLESIGDTLVTDIAGNLSLIGDKTVDIKEKFKDMAQSMLQDLAALIIKYTLLKSIMAIGGGEGSGNFLSNFAGGALNKLGFTAMSSALPSSSSNSMPSSSMSNARMFSSPTIANPTGVVNNGVVSRAGGNNGGGNNIHIYKIDAVDSKSFVSLLSSRTAQSTIAQNILANKGHNGIVRNG